MEPIEKVLSERELKDLEPTASNEVVTFTIEPTEVEVGQMIDLMRTGATDKEVKVAVRRVVMEGDQQKSAQGFSYAQIEKVRRAWMAKVAELKNNES